MINAKAILNKVCKPDESPVMANAMPIASNADIVGNLNSQWMYLQTKDKDEGLQKMAENKYLEKIASMKPATDWGKRLVGNFTQAEPIAQLGMGAGAVFGLDKLKTNIQTSRNNKSKADIENKSLKALHGINRNLSKAVITPSSPSTKGSK